MVKAPLQGLAPVKLDGEPLAWGMSRLKKTLGRVSGWTRFQDVYSPIRDSAEQLCDSFFRPTTDSADWTRDDEVSLVESLVRPLEREKIVKGFHQTSSGNCALVATIKAAMKQFGNQVQRHIRLDKDDVWHLTLRDGNQVQISKERLAQTRSSAKLEGDCSELLFYALLLYAAAASRKADLAPALELEKGFIDGWLSKEERFKRALHDLANGHSPKNCATYLGIGEQLRQVDLRDSNSLSKQGTIVFSCGHAVYTDGQEVDHYGESQEYDGTDTNGRKLVRGYRFDGPGLKEEDGWFYI